MHIRHPALRRAALWLPAAAWYALIFFFSSQTGTESTAVSDGVLTHLFGLDLSAMPQPLMDLAAFLVRKSGHMFIFFVLTALLLLPLKDLLPPWGRRRAAALGLCAVLAGLDEFHQTFVPGRSGRVTDVLIDCAGGACLLVLLWVITRLRSRRSPSP